MEELRKQYNTIADAFSDNLKVDAIRVSRDAFRDILPPLAGKKVADLGCGEGTDTAFYATQGAEVIGVDASEELLQKAQNQFPNVRFEQGSFEKTPFADAELDIVLTKYAIQTSPDLQPVFTEAARILKSGGVFQLLVTHPIRQFYEKRAVGKDYFAQEVVDCVVFDGAVTFKEPSHTLGEYFPQFMLEHFTLEAFDEKFDPTAEKIGDTYPGFLILQWKKK